VIVAGEQTRKRRTTDAENVLTWNDFYDGHKVRFASFVPPGRYVMSQPHGNEFRRLDHFDRAILREVKSPATEARLHEIELVFSSTKEEQCRFFVSGFDLRTLPQLPIKDYPKGMYMPMGIGLPPFYQTYEELQKNPSWKGAYVSVLLDGEGRWIDHHHVAIRHRWLRPAPGREGCRSAASLSAVRRPA
jgi:hypothetical protein